MLVPDFSHKKSQCLSILRFKWFKADMTVKELIERLNKENPEALVYYEYEVDTALMVTDIKANVLSGKDETVLIT